MKKIFLLAFAFVMTAAVSQAQIKLGVKAGVNIANLDFEFDGFSFSPDSKTSFHAGLMAKYQINEMFGIQPELVYSDEGADLGDDQNFDLAFINIPVLLTYNPTPVFNIHVGPQFGILTKAEIDGEDFKDEMKSLNLSLGIGAAAELDNGFTGGVRYNLGISDLNDSEDDGSIKSNVFQIYVGYFFRR